MTSGVQPQDNASTCCFRHRRSTQSLSQLLPTPGLQQVVQDPAGSKQHLRHPRQPQAPLPCRHVRAAAVRPCTAARAAAAGASALPCGVGAAGPATPRLCCSSRRCPPTACAGTAAHRLPRSWAATAALQDNQGTAPHTASAQGTAAGPVPHTASAKVRVQGLQFEQHMVRVCVWMGGWIVCCSRGCSQGRHTTPCMHDKLSTKTHQLPPPRCRGPAPASAPSPPVTGPAHAAAAATQPACSHAHTNAGWTQGPAVHGVDQQHFQPRQRQPGCRNGPLLTKHTHTQPANLTPTPTTWCVPQPTCIILSALSTSLSRLCRRMLPRQLPWSDLRLKRSAKSSTPNTSFFLCASITSTQRSCKVQHSTAGP